MLKCLWLSKRSRGLYTLNHFPNLLVLPFPHSRPPPTHTHTKQQYLQLVFYRSHIWGNSTIDKRRYIEAKKLSLDRLNDLIKIRQLVAEPGIESSILVYILCCSLYAVLTLMKVFELNQLY